MIDYSYFHNNLNVRISFFHNHQGRIQDFSWEGALTLQEGVLTYKFARFYQKLHEIKKILVRRGRPPWIRYSIMDKLDGLQNIVSENRSLWCL